MRTDIPGNRVSVARQTVHTKLGRGSAPILDQPKTLSQLHSSSGCKTPTPRHCKPWVSLIITVGLPFEQPCGNANAKIHSLVLHKNHFRKDWQRRVRTWFDQPGRKLRRRTARKTKAATLGVRPKSLLRPAVRGQTVRYNAKLREGRGFTLAELKEAGVGRKEALGLGITVDHRRRNLSEEGKKLNVERLAAYKARLIVFPRKVGKPKKGDSQVSLIFYLIHLSACLTYLRAPTSLPRPLMGPSPFPPPTFTNNLARSPPRSETSRLTALFVLTERTPGTRERERSGRRRSTYSHLSTFPYLT